MKYLIFTVDSRSFALELSYIERVVWAAALIPIPKDEIKHTCGMINVFGNIMPVVSMRGYFQLPERDMELSDQFIICQSDNDRIALWVDKVLKVVDHTSKDLQSAEHLLSNNPYVRNVIKDKNNIVLVWNISELFHHEKNQVQ